MTRAPDHAFADELRSGGTQRCRRPAEHFGDVARPVRPWPEFGHCAQVALLDGGQAVEPDAKEALIERCDSRCRSPVDIGERDRRRVSRVPRVLAPFLDEIWISVRLVDETFDGRRCDLDAQARTDCGSDPWPIIGILASLCNCHKLAKLRQNERQASGPTPLTGYVQSYFPTRFSGDPAKSAAAGVRSREARNPAMRMPRQVRRGVRLSDQFPVSVNVAVSAEPLKLAVTVLLPAAGVNCTCALPLVSTTLNGALNVPADAVQVTVSPTAVLPY